MLLYQLLKRCTYQTMTLGIDPVLTESQCSILQLYWLSYKTSWYTRFPEPNWACDCEYEIYEFLCIISCKILPWVVHHVASQGCKSPNLSIFFTFNRKVMPLSGARQSWMRVHIYKPSSVQSIKNIVEVKQFNLILHSVQKLYYREVWWSTLPIYPGLGQAPNMLDCLPGGLVHGVTHKPWIFCKNNARNMLLLGNCILQFCKIYSFWGWNLACMSQLYWG